MRPGAPSCEDVAREAGVALGRVCWVEESAPGAGGPRTWLERVRGLAGWRRGSASPRAGRGDPLKVYSAAGRAANRVGVLRAPSRLPPCPRSIRRRLESRTTLPARRSIVHGWSPLPPSVAGVAFSPRRRSPPAPPSHPNAAPARRRPTCCADGRRPSGNQYPQIARRSARHLQSTRVATFFSTATSAAGKRAGIESPSRVAHSIAWRRRAPAPRASPPSAPPRRTAGAQSSRRTGGTSRRRSLRWSSRSPAPRAAALRMLRHEGPRLGLDLASGELPLSPSRCVPRQPSSAVRRTRRCSTMDRRGHEDRLLRFGPPSGLLHVSTADDDSRAILASARGPSGIVRAMGSYDMDDGDSPSKGRFKPAFFLGAVVIVIGGAAALFFGVKSSVETMSVPEQAKERKDIELLPKAEQPPGRRRPGPRDSIQPRSSSRRRSRSWRGRRTRKGFRSSLGRGLSLRPSH